MWQTARWEVVARVSSPDSQTPSREGKAPASLRRPHPKRSIA